MSRRSRRDIINEAKSHGFPGPYNRGSALSWQQKNNQWHMFANRLTALTNGVIDTSIFTIDGLKNIFMSLNRANLVGELKNTIINREKSNRLRAINAEILQGKYSLRTTDYQYIEYDNMRTRIYYINNLDIDATSVAMIMRMIYNRVDHAVRTRFGTSESNVHISFNTRGSEHNRGGNNFTVLKIKNITDFVKILSRFNEQFHADNKDYILMVDKIIIKIVRENSGGCSDNRHNKHMIIKGIEYIQHGQTKNNNCFFKCIQNELNIKVLTNKQCNNMRAAVGVSKDDTIPISKGIEIFNKFVPDAKNLLLRIVDNSTGEIHNSQTNTFPTNVIIIKLQNNHYTLQVGDIIEIKKCPLCMKTYKNKHKCNRSNIEYIETKIRKNRVLLTTIKKDAENNNAKILHYDIETYQRDVDGNKIHTPYIVGFTYNDEYNTIEGDDCMDKFVRMIFENDNMKDIHINAYNGSNFDHYFFVQSFEKLYGAPQTMNMNNGSIIIFKHEGRTLIDLCKHLGGKLKDNLKAWDCNILKGDFDHAKASRWEEMPQDLRDKCHEYLRADVMGLKELYEKYNNAIFERYQLNISRYISTSSLTFNIWKSEMANNTDIIHLPNMAQEKAFRQAIRGGRTYKSKHKFISAQYNDFIAGKISYDQIEDYLIDADVVSLYPTAMAKYEYPIGKAKETNILITDSENMERLNKLIAKRDIKPDYTDQNAHLKNMLSLTNKKILDNHTVLFGGSYESSNWGKTFLIQYVEIIDNNNKLTHRMKIFDNFKLGFQIVIFTDNMIFINNREITIYLTGGARTSKITDTDYNKIISDFTNDKIPSINIESYDWQPSNKKINMDLESDYINFTREPHITTEWAPNNQIDNIRARCENENIECLDEDIEEIRQTIATEDIKIKMGIYHVHIKPNKNLLHSITGRRDNKGALIWDLEDATGWYTSIEIEDMLQYGYQVEIVKPQDGPAGYYWDKTAFIFKDFIEQMFALKNSEKKGTPRYLLSKLMMNALYGKMLQRPITKKTKFINKNEDYWKFFFDNEINEFEQIGSSWFISGTPRCEEKRERCITKPTQIGAFVLAYSRRIMTRYMYQSNPSAKILASRDFNNFSDYDKNQIMEDAIKNDFYYTDTDSLQMHQRNVPKLGKNLGDLSSDLDDVKIIRGFWIAPKLYALEYVNSKGEIKYHYRGKGIDSKKINMDAYISMDGGTPYEDNREFSFKKIHTRRNKNQLHIEPFSIEHLRNIKRVVNMSPWGGRIFNGNDSLPHGNVHI